jgi:hypothetical protein
VDRSVRNREFFTTIVFFGSLWGLLEASLGHLLHVLPEFLPLPPMSGVILFPIGLMFMMTAMRRTGSSAAIPATAIVAAAIKAATIALPFVTFRYIRNPVIAILSEGAVAWIVLGATGLKMDITLPLKAIVMSLGWRALFFASNIIFGLSGIANKPAILQRQFIFLDGFIDAAIIVITAVIIRALIQRTDGEIPRRTFGKIPALVSLFVGIGGQALFATL